MTRRLLAAGVLVWALAASAFAQGNSQGHGNGNGQSNGKGNSAPPSRNELAPVATVAPPSTTSTPLAWIDDATLLDPGVVALSIGMMRWQGTDLSEVDAPVVDAAIGLAPRVQLSASVPRIVGDQDPAGAVGGVGTSFVTAKIQAAANRAKTVKLAVAPTLQLLGAGVATALGPNESRVRFGLPVSVEVDHDAVRLYGGGGYFSPGLWFTGAAVGFRATPKTFVNVGLSRAWRSDEGADVALSDRDRKELSAGVAYAIASHVSIYGSVATTIATLDANGAGRTIAGGVSFWTAASPR
jgi:hypothetical protein